MSFEKVGAAQSPVSTTAVVPVAAAPVAVATKFATPASQIEGDLSGTTVPIPYLALTQKTSGVVDEHPEWMGKWCYDKTTLVGLPADPKQYSTELTRALSKDSVLGIVTKVKVGYEEKIEFDSGIIPQRWASAAEARASGVEYQEVGTIDVLLAFDGDHDQVRLVGGFQFLPARLIVKKSAYRNVAGAIIRDSSTWLHGDTCSGWYEFAVNKITGKQTYWSPVAKGAGKVSAELREAIRNEFGV